MLSFSRNCLVIVKAPLKFEKSAYMDFLHPFLQLIIIIINNYNFLSFFCPSRNAHDVRVVVHVRTWTKRQSIRVTPVHIVCPVKQVVLTVRQVTHVRVSLNR